MKTTAVILILIAIAVSQLAEILRLVYADPPMRPSVINVRYLPEDRLPPGTRNFVPEENHRTWGNRTRCLGAIGIVAHQRKDQNAGRARRSVRHATLRASTPAAWHGLPSYRRLHQRLLPIRPHAGLVQSAQSVRLPADPRPG